MTLTEFLLACIAEDEEWAKWMGAAQDAERSTGLAFVSSISSSSVTSAGRVLAECDAKRLRLKIADDLEGEAGDDTYGWAHSVAEQIRKVEALPYADHPDYREEWKP